MIIFLSRSHAQIKYRVRETFFDKIDTDDKSYILGLIAADGYNYSPHNTVSISLHKNDLRLLEQIRDLIYIDEKPISVVKNMVVLTIYNEHISRILYNYGLVDRKSLTLKYLECIPKKYNNSFIRGYFDGDGSNTKGSKKDGYSYFTYSIVGTFDFLNSINNILCNETKIKRAVIHKTHSKIHVISRGGKQNYQKFKEYIYSGECNLFLERKFNKFKI